MLLQATVTPLGIVGEDGEVETSLVPNPSEALLASSGASAGQRKAGLKVRGRRNRRWRTRSGHRHRQVARNVIRRAGWSARPDLRAALRDTGLDPTARLGTRSRPSSTSERWVNVGGFLRFPIRMGADMNSEMFHVDGVGFNALDVGFIALDEIGSAGVGRWKKPRL